MKDKANMAFKHICKEDTYMFNYTQLPDELFTISYFSNLSLQSKVLYSFMLRRVSLSKKNNWIDEVDDVYIYYRSDEIMEKFNCSNKTATKIMAELEEIGLIEKKRQGQGKPDIIYVNKFSEVSTDCHNEEPELLVEDLKTLHFQENEKTDNESITNSEVNKLHIQKCKKYISKNVENTSLEVKNLHPNYKENNNKDVFNSSSTISDKKDEEKYKNKIHYQEAARLYSAKVASSAFDEFMKRDDDYKQQFTDKMFLQICKTVANSKEPVIYLSGFLNWCYDHISFIKPMNTTNQFGTFVQQEYDFDEIEKELLSN